MIYELLKEMQRLDFDHLDEEYFKNALKKK